MSLFTFQVAVEGPFSPTSLSIFLVFGSQILAGILHPQVWQYGLWSFQTGGMKLKRFLPKEIFEF